MFARTLIASFPTPVRLFAVAKLAGLGTRVSAAGYEVEQPQPPQVDPSMRGNPLAPAPVNPGRRPEEDRAMRRSLNTLAFTGGSVFTVTATRHDRLPGNRAFNAESSDCQSLIRGTAGRKPDAYGADPRWCLSHGSTGRAIAGHAK